MKKMSQIFIALSILLLLIACGQNDDANEALDILDPDNRNPEGDYDEERRAQLGYVRYTKEEMDVDDQNEEIVIDREQVADMITRMALQTGNFNEVATLVTDDKVVIAYEKEHGVDEKEAAAVATKTAQSILPQFFDIHTTSNPYHMNEIHSLHLERTDNKDDQQVIERIIQGIIEENQESHRR